MSDGPRDRRGENQERDEKRDEFRDVEEESLERVEKSYDRDSYGQHEPDPDSDPVDTLDIDRDE